jgi:hypothetical protein
MFRLYSDLFKVEEKFDSLIGYIKERESLVNKTIQTIGTIPTTNVTYKDGRWVDSAGEELRGKRIDAEFLATNALNVNVQSIPQYDQKIADIENRVAALEKLVEVDETKVSSNGKDLALTYLLIQLKLLADDPVSGYVFVPKVIDAYNKYLDAK